MPRVLVTGSADGLGRLAAEQLVAGGHEVVLHARSPERARDAWRAVPGAAGVLIGDLDELAQMRAVAEQALAGPPLDAVIHNAAVGYREPRRIETADGLAHVFATNTLAPYVLTALMPDVPRLVYLSSGLHRQGDPSLADLQWCERPWSGMQAYSDSKLHDAILAMAVARLRPAVAANALTPGWVPTRMGGPGAPDDLAQGADTQVWLAVSDDPAARASGGYLYHRRPAELHPAARDEATQERLLAACAALSGVALR